VRRPVGRAQPAAPERNRMSAYTRDEMMTVAAARLLRDGQVCFVGIGLPSAACNLARLTHAPGLVLIYESGTIGTRPTVLPLSIGDGELAETATCVVPLPEIFSDYLQAGRIDVGFLGAAQIDRFGNLNSTVIGPYARPRTRLPGAGGATEIAAHARQVFIVMKATKRSFVPQLDFQTSGGLFPGRAASGARGGGPAVVVTDVGVLKPQAKDGELALAAVYPGIPPAEAVAAIGWPLALAPEIDTIAAPTAQELEVLRALEARTEAAHRTPVRLPL
jgi:glutaconate CoA-transferase subunit B